MISDLVGKATDSRISGLLYPFGHGLSYTTFKYSDLKITPDKTREGGSIKVSCKVMNAGTRKGDEVVQLYVNDKVSSVTTYEKVLRGFERINLNPGQTKEVGFTLQPSEHLTLLDRDMNRVVEPGQFQVMVGSSSEDIRSRGQFEIIP
jgi:beta-glucosidase